MLLRCLPWIDLTGDSLVFVGLLQVPPDRVSMREHFEEELLKLGRSRVCEWGHYRMYSLILISLHICIISWQKMTISVGLWSL